MSTKTFGGTQTLSESDAVQSFVNSLGTDIFKQGTVLRIEIEGAEPILIKPKQETVFGRRDPATGTMPDVDLTPFAGYRMGVSRKHAIIRQSENGEHLDLFDQGSSNGTFLNGTRLSANKPYKVRDGDEVRFGQMMMRLYFQKAPDEVAPSISPASTPENSAATVSSTTSTSEPANAAPNVQPANSGTVNPTAPTSPTNPASTSSSDVPPSSPSASTTNSSTNVNSPNPSSKS